MQRFVCPKCGHSSEFDPWKGSACCPECGYLPTIEAIPRRLPPIEESGTHYAFLDELMAHWDRSHEADRGIGMPTAEYAESFFAAYQRSMGEGPQQQVGILMRYVRNYVPRSMEIYALVQAYIWLRRGEYDAAARELRRLTNRSSRFADAWLWLSAATNDPVERQDCLEHALALQPAHPLARDAWAVFSGRVEPAALKWFGEQGYVLECSDCPQCGANLHYEPGGLRVTCEYCGHVLKLQSTDQSYRKAKLVGDLRLQRRYQGHTWAVIERIVRCQSCGAELVMTNHIARQCLHCGSTNVLVQDSERSFERPDHFLPFSVGQVDADMLIRRAQRTPLAKLVPQLGADVWPAIHAQGIYLPFWSLNAYVEVGTWIEDESGALRPTQGPLQMDAVVIENLLLPGVWVPPAQLLTEVLPFDLHALIPYDARVIVDWPVALYTVDVEHVVQPAYGRMRSMAEERIESRGNAFPAIAVYVGSDAEEHVSYRRSYQISGVTYSLLLLPFWLAPLQFGSHQRLAVVNGQTGVVAIGPPQAG